MSKDIIGRIADYSVIVIALSALVVSVWQVKLFQEHNKLSVKPYLDFSLIQTDSTITVYFYNDGLGPAIIKEMTFESNDTTYSSLGKVLVARDEMKNVVKRFNYSKNSVIATGDEKLLVELRGNHMRKVKVTIFYETVYEEKSVFQFYF